MRSQLIAGLSAHSTQPVRIRLVRVITLLMVVYALYTIGRFGIDQIRPPGMVPQDFSTFRLTVARLHAHEAIYNPDDPSPFKYSPTFLLIYASTLGQLEFHLAWIVACIVSACAFSWALRWLCVNGLELEHLTARKLAALFVVCGVFGWHGYIEHYSYGQIDMLVVSGFIAAVAFERTEALSAFFLALILITKPQIGITAAYFLMTRRWRILGLATAFTLALLLAPSLVWGWDRQLEFFSQWKAGLSHQSLEFMTGNINQSVAATLARLSGHREIVNTLTFAVVAAAAALALLMTAALPRLAVLETRGRVRLVVFTLMLYITSSPLSWRWITFLWLPAGLIVASDGLLKRSPFLLAILGLFAINGLLLQTVVAHGLGISEIDELSRIGLYTLGNLLLLLASLYTLRNPYEVSRLSSREPFSDDS